MWYLHNHFVCARLLALCAIAAPSFLAISDLNNRYARRKDLICKAKVFSTRIAGGFMFRTLLVLNKAKALITTTRIAGGLLLGYNPNYTCPGLKSFALHFVQVTIAI